MYKGVAGIFVRYWRAYGGAKALVSSPYFHVALLLTAITWGYWSKPLWWDQVIGVLPNLLGFTLGGFAVFLGFGDEKFRALLAGADEDEPDKPSLYVSLCATFVHFIIIQILALLYAILSKSWWFFYEWPAPIRALIPCLNMLGGAIGYSLFLYSVTSILAATMHMFRIATWYEQHQQNG